MSPKNQIAKRHMGFEAAAESVADRQNLPLDRARAIIASGARKASPAAKRANPRLLKVSGVKK